MSEPVNIMGVVAFPNENGKRDCRFIDSDYNTLFTVPDGGNIIVTDMDGRESVLECRYIDDTHVAVGGTTAYHICQFAEIQEQNARVYRPEQPKEGDCCNTYTIYQLKDTRETSYGYMPFEAAKDKLHPSHYRKAYQGMLAPSVTLESLFRKHNMDGRPFGQRMRSMSMSDVVVVKRNGEEKAYYVDRHGFAEMNRFLHPPQRQARQQRPKKKSRPER